MGEEKRPRYVLLDALRGLCVVSMIAYHAMYDIVAVQGAPVRWFFAWPGHLWQQSICWTFILLSGACWGMSKRPAEHGMLLVLSGFLVTAVTYFAMPSELIRYGVLTLLGCSGLLLFFLDSLRKRWGWNILPAAGLAASVVLFFLCREVPRGWLGFEGLRLIKLPAALYQASGLELLGLPGPGFISSDYFPLVPWFFLYLAGHFLWKILEQRRPVTDLLRREVPVLRPLAFVGRHSLLLYLLHQPLLMGIFLLIS